ARRAVPRPRAARRHGEPPRARQAARKRAHAPDGRAEARHRACLRQPRLRADQGTRGAGGPHGPARAARRPGGPVLLARYFFTFIRSIHALTPTSNSARNLRVVSSVSLPLASNLVCAAP